MLRSAGKNVAVNRFKFVPQSLGPVYRQYGDLPLLPRHILVPPIRHRLLSTEPPSIKSNAADSELPPPSVTPRKQKLDFKPGPIKSTSPQLGSSSPHLRSPSVHRKPHYYPPRHSQPPKPFETSLSAVQLAKQDIENAGKQGVLELPPEDATPFKRFVHQAMQLLKFYFRGVRKINVHRKEVSAIRSRISSGGAVLSRAEARLIRTYKQDVLKLVPFVIMILVAEELIPFAALYAPRMLPSTCILPGQRDRIASKSRVSQLGALFSHRDVYEALCREGERSGFVTLRTTGVNPGALCRLLGLPAWGPSPLALWRVKRHLETTALDDKMLREEGRGSSLTITELQGALLERGMIPAEKASLDDLRDQLHWWLDTAEVSPEGSNPVSRRLLMLGLIGSQK
ncbi:hypothetical protein F5I97DRAFT_691998 [Phlebopus sp. FC_14]|nr:hypothetical protein F5I97DRAFT_691998 [Phlebopus sp. FC_14]